MVQLIIVMNAVHLEAGNITSLRALITLFNVIKLN
jgi:hypothetical protein